MLKTVGWLYDKHLWGAHLPKSQSKTKCALTNFCLPCCCNKSYFLGHLLYVPKKLLFCVCLCHDATVYEWHHLSTRSRFAIGFPRPLFLWEMAVLTSSMTKRCDNFANAARYRMTPSTLPRRNGWLPYQLVASQNFSTTTTFKFLLLLLGLGLRKYTFNHARIATRRGFTICQVCATSEVSHTLFSPSTQDAAGDTLEFLEQTRQPFRETSHLIATRQKCWKQ